MYSGTYQRPQPSDSVGHALVAVIALQVLTVAILVLVAIVSLRAESGIYALDTSCDCPMEPPSGFASKADLERSTARLSLAIEAIAKSCKRPPCKPCPSTCKPCPCEPAPPAPPLPCLLPEPVTEQPQPQPDADKPAVKPSPCPACPPRKHPCESKRR